MTAVDLLEREHELAVLDTALDAARDGQGALVVVAGEAGIGKSALVAAWAEAAGGRARVLIGACDDLIIPRALGPFRDMVAGGRGPLADALGSEAGRDVVLDAALAELSNPLHPTVAVLEDLHWADEATLDAVRFLARRITSAPAVVVLTHRDDLADDHPLRALLGELVGAHVRRLVVQGLSLDATARLARAAAVELDVTRLHELTGGNPYLVGEVLASGSAVPPTVRDAVAARIAELPPDAQQALEQLAVMPLGLEPSFAGELLPGGLAALVDAERRGLVEVIDGRLRFRHELTRRAVVSATPTVQRAAAHAAALAVLERHGAEPSRLVHHALGAGDGAAVARWAPTAARAAARVGAHRDAVALHEHALVHAGSLPREEAAELRVAAARELLLANRLDDAVAEAGRAVAAWETLGTPEGVGAAHTVLARTRYWALDAPGAVAAAERAVEVLRPTGDGQALAEALATLAFVLVMSNRFEAALEPAAEGVTVAEEAGDRAITAYALTQLGTARVQAGHSSGLDDLQAALDLGASIPDHEQVAHASVGFASGAFRLGQLDKAEEAMDRGIADADAHGIEVGVATLRMMRHGLDLARGDWDRADAGLEGVVGDGTGTGWGETVAGALLGRLRARRGDAAAAALLERSWALATRSGEVQRVGPAGAALAEWAWLGAVPFEQVAGRVDEAIRVARDAGHGWYLGELLRYRAWLDPLAAPDDDVPEPWASGLRGDWEAAAAEWERRGWPYEHALELVASGLPDPMVDGLATLDQLGAIATAVLVRRRLRGLGVKNIPRGPRQETRDNPAGLTPRQVEVLALLAGGATNAEIAQRLVLSVRTVDHHVSAVLAKLGVASRRDAAVRAAELELVDAAAVLPTWAGHPPT